jgi:peptidoglycan/xylan/chitin deacetylase (PgdA/CDA1 family)
MNQGDYNQDSFLNINDLTPLGFHYNKREGAGDWTAALVADGNSDGLVFINDLTAIGQNFGRAADEYMLQVSDTAEADGDWWDVAPVHLGYSSLPAAGGRRQFTYVFDSFEVGRYYRVVPALDEDRGIPSSPYHYTGDLEPVFSVSGTCTNGAGQPLGGVQLTLEGESPQFTGPDGSFSFIEIPDGYSALLTPSAEGLVFMPQTWVVHACGADVEDIALLGFALDHLACTLPAEADANTAVTFEIHAADAAGQALAGFDTDAAIAVSPPSATLLQQPEFVDGIAQASVEYHEPGQYTVSIFGLDSTVDGLLGQITITSSEPPEIYIEKWYGGAEAALSLTFDDGTADHWERGMQLWEDYGFRVTLGILATRFQSEPSRLPQLQQAYDAGHELANHTTIHPDLTTLTEAQRRQELETCNALLLDNVEGLDYIYTVIYPYEQFNDDVLSQLADMGYFFARSGHQGIVDYAMPNDAWDPPLLHLYSWANLNMLSVSMWNSTTDVAVTSGDWLIEQCHGIGEVGEAGVGWSPRPEWEFRAHYDHIASYGERLWVAPLSEVGRYLIQRNNASIDILSFDSQQLDFTVTDALDSTHFNIPLTVSMERPAGWSSVSLRQELTDLSYAEPQSGWLRFDVTAGGGVISILNIR